MSWKNKSLDRLFVPQSIAIIGASDKPNKLGFLTLKALSSFQGNVFPINPRLQMIGDMQCYSNIRDIEHQIDLAIIAVGPQHVIPAISDCAEVDAGGAIIFSAGFKELGGIGNELERKLREIVDESHIAVIGPNCLGAGNLNIGMNATFFPHPVPMKKGSVAMVSQSGGVTGLMLYRASDSRLGVSKFASVGNRVNIDFHDMIQYFRHDDETEVICLFVEGTEYAREMVEEMKITTPHKPIIVFKVGKTPASKEAALSHTGSLAGNADIYSAAITQAGGLEVSGVNEMIDTAYLLSVCNHRPKSNRIAIVTHTLGIALIAAQTLELRGMDLPLPRAKTKDQIQELLNMPVEIPIKNPIDLLAQGWAQPTIFAKAFETILHEDYYDSLVIVFAPNYQEGIGGGVPVDSIIKATKSGSKPVVSILSSPERYKPPGCEKLEEAGIPFFSSPQRAATALANMVEISKKEREATR